MLNFTWLNPHASFIGETCGPKNGFAFGEMILPVSGPVLYIHPRLRQLPTLPRAFDRGFYLVGCGAADMIARCHGTRKG